VFDVFFFFQFLFLIIHNVFFQYSLFSTEVIDLLA
jgi:hypothetical protein